MAGTESLDESLSEEVRGELEALAAIYAGDGEFVVEKGEDGCHDNNSCSDYVCEVVVKPADMMVGLCFSLSATYPETCPRIEIGCLRGELSDGAIAGLLGHLYHVAKETEGSPHLFSLVEGAKEWLQDHKEEELTNSSRSSQEQREVSGTEEAGSEAAGYACSEDSSVSLSNKKDKKKSKKKGPQDDDEKFGRQTKKPPMKTASDVISRIQWDDQLDADHFTVGYLDRFIGVLEQPFTSFYWEDISGVDQRTLAIPRHRIQYFKYKDDIVWDKTQRLDNVFGSLGSGVTIVDVVEWYGKENASEREGCDEKDSYDQELEDCEIGEGEDVDAKRTGDVSVASGAQGRRRVNKSRPNYFVAIQIADDDIRSQVKIIQDRMTRIDPLVSSYLIDPARLHITLCMLLLASEAQMNTALSVLKSIQGELTSMLLPVTLLRFRGIDTFHDRVLYVPLEPEPALEKIARRLREALANAGINLLGTREEFVPHLTVMKMPREEADGHPIFTSDLKANFSDMQVGTQAVDAIHLCSLADKPAQDKFYHSIAKVDLLE